MENLPNYVLRKQSKFFWGAWNYYCRQTYFFQAWFTFTFDNSCPPRAGHDLSFTPQVRPVFATAGMLWEGHWTGGHKWWRNLGSYQKWGKQSSTQKYSSNVLESTSSKRCKTFFEQCDQEGMYLLKWCWRYWDALQYHSHSTTKPDKQHIHTNSTTKDNQQSMRYINNSTVLKWVVGMDSVKSPVIFRFFQRPIGRSFNRPKTGFSWSPKTSRPSVIEWVHQMVRRDLGSLENMSSNELGRYSCLGGFFMFTPKNLGKMNPFYPFWRIFLSDELRPPTSCISLCCSKG